MQGQHRHACLDATLRELATADTQHREDADTQRDSRVEDVEEGFADEWYGEPIEPPFDPDTPEGTRILRLFRRIKDIEHSDGSWSLDVIDLLTTWFSDLGIDPEENPTDAGTRLRLALRDDTTGRTPSAIYSLRIGTDHDDAEPLIRIALHALARQLGPGTCIDLVSDERDLLARIEQIPNTHQQTAANRDERPTD